MNEAIAAYRARSSDVTMIRWIAPAIALVMILLGVAFPGITTIIFVAVGLFIAGRWYWVARVLAFEIDVDPSNNLRVKTRFSEIEMKVNSVRTLSPSGLRKRAKGPHRLGTDSGWYMLFPEGIGYADVVAAIQAQSPSFLVVESGEADAERPMAEFRFAPSAGIVDPTAPVRGPEGAARPTGLPVARGETPGPTANEGLAPGVIAMRIYGSAALADAAVRRLADEGVTALAILSPGGVGGVRLTVKEEDAARAASIIDR